MIAGCIDRIGTDACGGCERRDACSRLFGGLFGMGTSTRHATPRRGESTCSPLRDAFLAMLGQVAKSVERDARARRAAGRGGVPPRAPAKAPAPIGAPAPPTTGVAGRFSEEVERHIEPLLASGRIRVEQVARELGYSRQTLYRRLKEEGVTFERLLDGLRRRLALRLVGEQGLPVKEAAWRLGFSDPAAFSRAFKRWTGTSPRKMRPARRPAPGQSG